MKKFIATTLAVIYLATSVGATVNMHYCMGKLLSVDGIKKEKCSKCAMKKAKGCCEDKVKLVKAQTGHQPATQAILFQPFASVIHTTYPEAALAPAAFQSLTSIHNNSPPGLSGTDRCVLYSIFRL